MIAPRRRSRLLIAGTVVVVAAGAGSVLSRKGQDSTQRVAAPTSAQPAPGAVRAVDLGTLGGTQSAAVAINDHGQVVGTSSVAGSQGAHGFLWQNGVMRDLGSLGGGESQPAALNERGQVVGASSTRAGPSHAFLWQGGKMTDLGVLPGQAASKAVAINDAGQVVGNSGDRAFLWQRGVMTNLGTLPGGADSAATAINARGQVVGTSATTNSETRAFLWQNGRMRELPGLPDDASESDAVAINDSGAILGDSDGDPVVWQAGAPSFVKLPGLGAACCELAGINPAGQVAGTGATPARQSHTILWQHGSARDLGTVPGRAFSVAAAIDARGRVVGYATSANGGMEDAEPVLWRDGRGTVIATLPGASRSDPVAINDHGEAVGYAFPTSTTSHAVLWTIP